jgi:hypothetical protein
LATTKEDVEAQVTEELDKRDIYMGQLQEYKVWRTRVQDKVWKIIHPVAKNGVERESWHFGQDFAMKA